MITRKQAIQVMIGFLSGVLSEAAKGQTTLIYVGTPSGELARIDPGDEVPIPAAEKAKQIAAYQKCLKEDEKENNLRLCLDPSNGFNTSFVPGTASMEVNLDLWKEFRVKMGGKTVTISRQEIWEALQK